VRTETVGEFQETCCEFQKASGQKRPEKNSVRAETSGEEFRTSRKAVGWKKQSETNSIRTENRPAEINGRREKASGQKTVRRTMSENEGIVTPNPKM
jgi:hypothetical protein